MSGGAVSSACRFAADVDAVVLSACLVVSSHRFPVSVLLPSGRLALLVPSSSIPYIVLASPRYHAVGGEVVGSSPLAPLVRCGGGERGAVGACGVGWCSRVRTMWYHHASFLIGWRRAACFVAVVLSYRPRSVPRAVRLLVSLLFVIRPVLRHGGRGVALRRSFSCGLVACAVACRAWGRGGVSAWRVIIMGRSRRGA